MCLTVSYLVLRHSLLFFQGPVTHKTWLLILKKQRKLFYRKYYIFNRMSVKWQIGYNDQLETSPITAIHFQLFNKMLYFSIFVVNSTEITTLILCRFALHWKQVKAMTTEHMPTHHRLWCDTVWVLYIRLRIHMWHFHLVIFSFEVVPLGPNDGLFLLLLTFFQLLLQQIKFPPALGDLHSGLQQHFAEYFNDLWGCRHHEPLH